MGSSEVEVLLPVHNEGASIEATIRGIYSEISRHARVGFIVCEDGSRDNTKEVLRRLAGELPIRLDLSDARKGYSLAVRDGMSILDAPYLLCLDSDGQCDPKDFSKFWAARSTADILIGWRVHRADTLARRSFSGIFFLLYQAVFRTPVHDPSCPFLLAPKTVIEQIRSELGSMKEGFWWEFVARAHRHGFTIHELPVNHRTRAAGRTQVYKPTKMLGIFVRHVAAIFQIARETRKQSRHAA